MLHSDEGLLLGNGDLSVSVYQDADRIIWRFGKGDVWDRRLDLSEDPKPAHISEIAHGIKVEGWKCPPYGGGPVEATRGTTNAGADEGALPGRPAQLQQTALSLPQTRRRAGPAPARRPDGHDHYAAPADRRGEAADQMHLAVGRADRPRMVHPAHAERAGGALERRELERPHPDRAMASRRFGSRSIAGPIRRSSSSPRSSPANTFTTPSTRCAIPRSRPCRRRPPAARRPALIEQAFPPDPTFPNGFRYLLVPFAPGTPISRCTCPIRTKRACASCPRDRDRRSAGRRRGDQQRSRRGQSRTGPRPLPARRGPVHRPLARLADANQSQRGGILVQVAPRLGDPLLENLWYETLHARRCAYRQDTVPPGLFLPSTVQDYSHWHGDYHLNYNIQEPFWGDYTANHLELGDAYFRGMDFLLQIGRKIAQDYYGCRGAFIQLTGYPIHAEDDPLGVVPMGRMAYMTGWAMNQYWWRFRYTLDTDWLRTVGYPVIRDCALFYTDFMKKGDDGLYHVFPSNQGEDGFTGNPKDYTDRPQVMQHMRYCLRGAIRAARRWTWTPTSAPNGATACRTAPATTATAAEARRTGKAVSRGQSARVRRGPALSSATGESRGLARHRPDGLVFRPVSVVRLADLARRKLRRGPGLPAFRHMIQRWRHPNGLVWGMAIANYGRAGAWTESLGVAAPLQEMMLQSWDGALRIFPAWPRTVDARFENFRAEGAFLVSASWSQGQVQRWRFLASVAPAASCIHPGRASWRFSTAPAKV